MSKEIQLIIVSPDKKVVDIATASIVAPGVEGYFGVMADHEPFVTELKIGHIVYQTGQNKHTKVAISGGFLEVSDNKAIVLADSAEKASDIDIERARESATRAKERLNASDGSIDSIRAQLALLRAVNRLRIAGDE